jgi:hypothetical protein
VGSVCFQLAVVKEVIFKLEQAQNRRQLWREEAELRTELKFKCLGLASLAHTIARQHSRILHLIKLQACHRSRKSFIDRLVHQGCTLVDEESKANAIFQHFNAIFGVGVPRSCALNFDQLQFDIVNLSGLDFCFSKAEIWSAIY